MHPRVLASGNYRPVSWPCNSILHVAPRLCDPCRKPLRKDDVFGHHVSAISVAKSRVSRTKHLPGASFADISSVNLSSCTSSGHAAILCASTDNMANVAGNVQCRWGRMQKIHPSTLLVDMAYCRAVRRLDGLPVLKLARQGLMSRPPRRV